MGLLPFVGKAPTLPIISNEDNVRTQNTCSWNELYTPERSEPKLDAGFITVFLGQAEPLGLVGGPCDFRRRIRCERQERLRRTIELRPARLVRTRLEEPRVRIRVTKDPDRQLEAARSLALRHDREGVANVRGATACHLDECLAGVQGVIYGGVRIVCVLLERDRDVALDGDAAGEGEVFVVKYRVARRRGADDGSLGGGPMCRVDDEQHSREVKIFHCS